MFPSERFSFQNGSENTNTPIVDAMLLEYETIRHPYILWHRLRAEKRWDAVCNNNCLKAPLFFYLNIFVHSTNE